MKKRFLPLLPDPPGQTSQLRPSCEKESAGVCDAGCGCSALCAEADSPWDPIAYTPLARTSPRDQPPPLAPALAAAPALAEAGSCCPGSCRGTWPLPAGAAARGSAAARAQEGAAPGCLSYHPPRAGWQGPLEVRAQPAAQDQGSPPQHVLRGGGEWGGLQGNTHTHPR